jgi:chromosomal replication initiator protein
MQDVNMDDPGSQETSQGDREQLTLFLAALAERIGKDRYDVWFGGNTRLSIRDQALYVETPNRFHQDWLRNHFRRDLEAVLTNVFPQRLTLEFTIDSSLQPAKPEPRSVAQPIVEQTTLFPDLEETPPPSDKAVTKPRKTRQNQPSMVAPALRTRRWCQLTSFVVGSSNRLGHAAISQVAEGPCEPNPLLIYGSTGTGKTHLLEGLISHCRQHEPERQCLFLTAEQFTSQFLEGLHGRGLPMFRRKYRSVDLLVVDDIQFLAGKQATLNEFLHTLDTLLREHRQIVLSADRPPHELHELGQQLTTRLAGGLVARLDAPDYQTRLQIVRQLATKQDLKISEEIVDLIASNLTEHVRELQGAVQRLFFAQHMQQHSLTLPEAESALSELLHRRGHHWNLHDIERAICQTLGLPAESLQSERRAKTLNTTRMLAMWLARKFTRAALSEIGSYFGKRSHSTVISAQKKVVGWINEQSTVAFGSKTWTVEEVVRRVEDNLRATG